MRRALGCVGAAKPWCWYSWVLMNIKRVMRGVAILMCLPHLANAQAAISPHAIRVVDRGTFDNAYMHEYAQSSIGNIDVETEYSSNSQGPRRYSTDALTGAIAVPSSSVQYGSNAVAGYATTASRLTNVDASYFQCRVVSNGGKCWGTNPVVIDTPGLTSGVRLLNEFDVQPQNPFEAYSAVNGLMMNFFAPGVKDGTLFANSFAFICTKGQPGGIWQTCYSTSDGAAGTFAQIGSTSTGPSSNSQVISANIRDSRNTIRQLSFFGDKSGSWTLNSYDGRLILDRNTVQVAILDSSENSAVRTYKTPDSSGTLVLEATEQNLSNKVLMRPVVASGIGGDGSGFKHERISTGAISPNARKEVVMKWKTSFMDTSYTVVCSVEDSSTPARTQGLTLERIRTHAAAEVGAVISNPTSRFITGMLDCTATHD